MPTQTAKASTSRATQGVALGRSRQASDSAQLKLVKGIGHYGLLFGSPAASRTSQAGSHPRERYAPADLSAGRLTAYARPGSGWSR
jgi:hypothetical protein